MGACSSTVVVFAISSNVDAAGSRGSFAIPSYTTPLRASTVYPWLVFINLVAFSAPTMQGMPNSRLTIAAWQVTPPLSVTIAPAIFIKGT